MANKAIDKYSDDSDLIGDLINNLPPQNLRFVDRSAELAKQVKVIMEEKKLRSKDLAVLMNKKESEISKLLSGNHNFTLRTLTHIETALGESIFFTHLGKELELRSLIDKYGQTETSKTLVLKRTLDMIDSQKVQYVPWNFDMKSNTISNPVESELSIAG